MTDIKTIIFKKKQPKKNIIIKKLDIKTIIIKDIKDPYLENTKLKIRKRKQK